MSVKTRPVGDKELIRSLDQRIRQLENPLSIRVGQWAINDVAGQLIVSKPGDAVSLTGTPVTGDVELPNMDALLRGFVTADEVDKIVNGAVGNATPGILDEVLEFVDETFADIPILGEFVDTITDVFGSLDIFLDLFTGFATDVPILGQIVEALTGGSGGLGDIIGWASGLLTGESPLDSLNLFNFGGIFGKLGVGQLSTDQIEMLDNPDFREAISLQGGGIWIYDESDGVDVPGCANVVANGILRQLRSNAMAVAQGDKITASIHTKWSSLAYTGTSPIKLQIVELLYSSITQTFATMGTVDIAGPASPGATQASWLKLTGNYEVPAGVSHIVLQLHVGANATAGTIKFDKGSVLKTGLLQIPWTEDLPGSLGDLFQGAQDMLDGIFEGITGFGQIGTLLEDVMGALRSIPFANVIGVGGPADIGGSMTSTWDQWISGLVGSIGSGAGLADLFNIGQEISSKASLGGFSWDILGIRNNKTLKTGFHSTSQSTISLDKLALGVAALPTVPVTQSTALTGYERVAESMDLGMVSWQGYGTTNVTDCYLNIYRMNQTTGVNTLIHASGNIVGLLTGGSVAVPVVYSLPTPVAISVSDVLGFEICVRGAGTHNVAGQQSGLQDQAVYPRRWSSLRNSGTSAAPSSFTPAYTTNVPLIEYGVSAGEVVIPHSPEIVPFQTAGSRTTPIPSWANHADVVVIGGGGGGHQGGTWGVGGEGGECGPWVAASWDRGTHFTGTGTVISSTTGTRGGGNSGNGQASTASIPGYSVTGPGGPGANNFDIAGSEHSGDSPGNYTFPYGGPPWVIAGGAVQNGYGAAGNTPGGGGGGGNWVSFQPGGPGGTGGVFIRFRQ